MLSILIFYSILDILPFFQEFLISTSSYSFPKDEDCSQSGACYHLPLNFSTTPKLSALLLRMCYVTYIFTFTVWDIFVITTHSPGTIVEEGG